MYEEEAQRTGLACLRCLVLGDYEGLKLASKDYDDVSESWLLTYVIEYSTGVWYWTEPNSEVNNQLPAPSEAMSWILPMLSLRAAPKLALLSMLRP